MTKFEVIKSPCAIYCGRFSPFHNGHKKIVEQMIYDIDNHSEYILPKRDKNILLVIGSSASERTTRVPFNYMERANFIKKIFPEIRIVPIADINIPNKEESDNIWMRQLDDIVYSVFPNNGWNDYVYYGGSEQDVEWYYSHGKKVKIVDRAELPINATAIRQMMMLGQDISPFVDERIAKNVVEHFQQIMKEEW